LGRAGQSQAPLSCPRASHLTGRLSSHVRQHRTTALLLVRTAEDTVREFWRLMATNDFGSVGQVLADTFVLEWPQSNERIRGAENFARMNAEYPAHGRWLFRINRVVATFGEVVTQAAITDGKQSAEAISFFEIADGKITRLVEYWPESYAPPANRAHLTEPIVE
jgi:ketosteroid isomerase-like protein